MSKKFLILIKEFKNNQHKDLTPDQMLRRLTFKTGKNSEKLKNKIKQSLYSL